MRPAAIYGLTLFWGLAGAALAHSDPEIEVFHPVTPEEAAIELLPAAAPAVATGLESAVRCSETKVRTAVVTLRWQAGAVSGGSQRIDISKLRDGFATGRYETTPRLPREQAAAGVEGAEPGINYYWRVLSEVAGGWTSSPIGRFEVPVCPWDEAAPSRSSGERVPPGGGR